MCASMCAVSDSQHVIKLIPVVELSIVAVSTTKFPLTGLLDTTHTSTVVLSSATLITGSLNETLTSVCVCLRECVYVDMRMKMNVGHCDI